MSIFDKMNESNDKLKLSVFNMRINDLVNELTYFDTSGLDSDLQDDFISLKEELTRVHEAILNKIGSSNWN
ncbi:MAG: hypothetical protein WAX77_01695 [Methylococcaceae bacterium]